jgi:hypothetical protein
MDITGIWEGTLDGTNWGRVLAKLQQSDDAISGFAQVTDVGLGTYNLRVQGNQQGAEILLQLSSGGYNVHEYEGTIKVLLTSVADNLIVGDWKSSIGTFGNFRAERQVPKRESQEALAKKLSDSNAAFIIMAFADQRQGYLPVVDIMGAIKRACDAVGVKAHRVDEVEHSTSITAVLLNEIKTHRFLISDLTHQRPNVYYEVGYAHGLGKEVILTAQEGTEVHFDIAGYNVIFYSSVTQLEERIIKRLRARMTTEERKELR